MSVDGFLDRHWQKSPLFMPGSLPPALPVLSADELAWLATLDDVEARLITTERLASGDRYHVQQGPFAESELRALPERDWTLLVHDVDKHLPELRAWFDAVPFIPDWRIDDLMVSCAAPGGSVGPHRDNYDVFLCQGSGRRTWHLAPPGNALPAADAGGLSLLQPFSDPAARTAATGDVLYLPPGVAHWGIAAGLCVTYSIGMRAPTRRELYCGIERDTGRAAASNDADERFYADADLAADEAAPGRISRRALRRAARLLADDAGSLDETARAFAAVVTDPKAWLEPEVEDRAALIAALAAGAGLPVHGMARLAWCELDGRGVAGINGHGRDLDARQLRILRELCATRRADLSLMRDIEFRDWLVDCAVFALPDS